MVDFIIHSVNDILQQEFGQTLGSKGVHILDPFTGTGTFITRLLQSGLIDAEKLEYKYKNEIHANEIVLLAYYIAAINIEATYHALSGGEYAPFNGICLTDTFEMYESEDMVAALMADNSERRTRQKALDIRVILGNPPYSAGQKSEGDNAKNVSYKTLDKAISETYAAQSQNSGHRYLYDSYIRAIKWSSLRLGDKSGIIAFVAGSGWLDKNYADGMRRCLKEEFSSIYVLNLRGDIRKNMLSKGAAGEGENIFAQGSMTGTCIVILVKNTSASENCIRYWDIGERLTQKSKLDLLRNWKKTGEIINQAKVLVPNASSDWINQRNAGFEKYVGLATVKNTTSYGIFESNSLGLETNMDPWAYNLSYSSQLDRCQAMVSEINQASQNNLKDEIDSAAIKWTTRVKSLVQRRIQLNGDDVFVKLADRRPFTREWVIAGQVTKSAYKMRAYFGEMYEKESPVISLSGVGARSGFTVLMHQYVADMQLTDNGQNFPLRIYGKVEETNTDLFANEGTKNGYRVKDGITDYGLKHFQDAYGNAEITKEDVFYYVYGLLHSDDYRTRFADNLSKELPRIPAVKQEADFWAFSVAGRKLGDLHVNYETVEKYPVTIVEGALELAVIEDPVSYFRVEKMKFAGKRPKLDKTTVHYNSKITMTDIPLEAYEYVVNGKSALDWVMERQCVKTDKKSGIVNDANDYANETMNNPAYPLELFQRVITVSLETMKIVRNLPKLEID